MRYEPASGVAPRATPITFVAGDSLDIDEPVTNLPVGATLLQVAVTLRRGASTVVATYLVTTDASTAGRITTGADGVPRVRIHDTPANTRGFLASGLTAEDLVYDCVVWVAHPGETVPRERTLRKGVCTVIADVTAGDTLTVPMPGVTVGPLDHATIAPATLAGSETDSSPITFVLTGFDVDGNVVTGGTRSFASDAGGVLTVVSGTGVATRQGPGTAHVTGTLIVGGITKTAVATVTLAAAGISGATPAFRLLPTKSPAPVLIDAANPLTVELSRANSYPSDVDTDGFALIRTALVKGADLGGLFPTATRIARNDLVSAYDASLQMLEVTLSDANPVMVCAYPGGGETIETSRSGYAGPVRTWAYLPDVRAFDSASVGKLLKYTLHYTNYAGAAVLNDAGAAITGTITLSLTAQHVEVPEFDAQLVSGSVRNIVVALEQNTAGDTLHFLCAPPATTQGRRPASWVPVGARLSRLPVHRTLGVVVRPSTYNAWGLSDTTGPACTVQNAAKTAYATTAIVATADAAPGAKMLAAGALVWRTVTLAAGERLTLDPGTATPLDCRVMDGAGDITTPGADPTARSTAPTVVHVGVEVRPIAGQATLADLRTALQCGLAVSGTDRARSAMSYDPILFARSSGGAHKGARRLVGRVNPHPAGQTDYTFVPWIENTGTSALTFDFYRPAVTPGPFNESRMGKWHYDWRPKPKIDTAVAINNETYVRLDHRRYQPRDAWAFLTRMRLPFDPFDMLRDGVIKIDILQGGPPGSASLGVNCAFESDFANNRVNVAFNWTTQPDRPDLSYIGPDGTTPVANPANGDSASAGFILTARGQLPAYTEFDIGWTGTGRKPTAMLFGIGTDATQVVTRGTGTQAFTVRGGGAALPVIFGDTVDDPAYNHLWQAASQLALWSDRDHTGTNALGKAAMLHNAGMSASELLAEIAAWNADADVGGRQEAPTDPLGGEAVAYPYLATIGGGGGGGGGGGSGFTTRGLVGDWSPSNSGTLADASGAGHPMTVPTGGSAPTYVAPSGGTGAFMHYAGLGVSAPVPAFAIGSAQAVIRTAATGAGSNSIASFSDNGGSTSDKRLYIESDGIASEIFDGTSERVARETTGVPAATIVHVRWVTDGSTLKVYVNNALRQTTATSGGSYLYGGASDTRYNIGQYGPGNTPSVDLEIGRVLLHNVVPTTAELAADYAAAKVIYPTLP